MLLLRLMLLNTKIQFYSNTHTVADSGFDLRGRGLCQRGGGGGGVKIIESIEG